MDERLWLTNWNSLYIQNDIFFTDAIKPVYVGFKITENCNQRCSHCWAGKNLTINHSFDEIIAALNKNFKSTSYNHYRGRTLST